LEKPLQKNKIVAVAHVSNALGTITCGKDYSDRTSTGNTGFIDGAQATPHMAIDVSIGC
jgi:selenocysteine lyase/cysteine desulfurase